MGEDKTIEFESGRQTLVFWNMDDYPIPVGTSDDLGAVSSNMFEALQQMGFRGYMSMEVYSEQPKSYEKEEWWMPQICYAPKCKSYSAIFHELPDIALWIIDMTSRTGPGPLNVALIAKPNGELLRVLRCLKSRNHDVLVIDPPPPCCPPLFSVASLLENARLLDGPKPRFKAMLPDYLYVDDIDEENLDIKEDVSKTVDFSERIPTVKGERTAVFWDAVDCPFPPSSTPDEIYHSIKSALVAKGFSKKKMTIWAYLDDDDDKKGSWRDALLRGDKTWASRIYFLPAGDKVSRRIRMLNDINLWIRDSPQMTTCYEASLVLVSDQFKDDDVYYRHMLQKLGNRHYYVLLVTPTLDINKPESPEWPGLLIDGGAYFFAKVKSQIYEGPSPTLHEADAEETPEELPIMSDMDYSLLCPFGDQTSDSSEDEDSPFWKPLTEEDMLIDGGQSFEEPAEEEIPLYRWDPHTLMYKLESLFPKEHEADTAAQEEIPLYRWDPHTLMFKLESLFPKDHEAEPERLATHGICRFETEDIKKPESPELPAGLLLDTPFGESSEDAEAEEMLDSLLSY